MAKRKRRRPRTFSEKVMIVLSILIAISMVLALFASFAAGGQAGF
jgi:predicted nucleic acid-binding Zn ribbon protein